MTATPHDIVFGDELSRIDESHLVPLIFELYASELAQRLVSAHVTRVLEIAAGTGVVTRALASLLPPAVEITATDLNPDMLRQATSRGTSRSVKWRQADAMALPFGDEAFDAVVCQFGMMFFPDKGKAFAEARRVLRVGGMLLFDVWDRIEENEFADEVTRTLASSSPTIRRASCAVRPTDTSIGATSSAICRAEDSVVPSRSRPSRRAVARHRQWCRPSRTARGRRSGTRSWLATRRGSTKPPTGRRALSRAGSALAPSMERSRRTSSLL